MKRLATIALLGATVAAPAMAKEGNLASIASAKQVFHMDSEQLQLAALSNEEMRETEGAIAPWILGGSFGALSGGGKYVVDVYLGSYSWNTRRFLGNVGTGALIGGSFGMAGALAGGGMSAGANIWRFNSLAANWGANHVWRR